jgi:hypothetical protein
MPDAKMSIDPIYNKHDIDIQPDDVVVFLGEESTAFMDVVYNYTKNKVTWMSMCCVNSSTRSLV